MLSPLFNLCGALIPNTSADWLYLTPDNGITKFKYPPFLLQSRQNGIICMQVTCSKRGKVRWIKMQFISFPMLWPNYGASFFHAIKSYRIGLDVKGCWFTASVSWLKLNPTCIKKKTLSPQLDAHQNLLVHRSHVLYQQAASSLGCCRGSAHIVLHPDHGHHGTRTWPAGDYTAGRNMCTYEGGCAII